MLHTKRTVLCCLVLLSFIVLTVTGCAGETDTTGDTNPGSFDGPVSADDYLGIWLWESDDKEYSVTLTINESIEYWERGTYHAGSMICDAVFTQSIIINGTSNYDLSFIELLIETYQHSITVKVFQEISDTETAEVVLSGELSSPGILAVCELGLKKDGEYIYHYESSDYDDTFLLFIKQPE